MRRRREYKLKGDVKYVLTWEENHLITQDIFAAQNCSQANCFFTNHRKFLLNYLQFDAIVFNENFLESEAEDRPGKRKASQIYIFNTLESSYNNPACNTYDDGFFNWTFTYRLDSDIVWSYFIVRNLTGAVVAPSVSAKWQRSSKPVPRRIKLILGKKKKAAAWLVSHCRADSFRDEYLTRLQEHLFHFALRIDVYGSCSQNKCPNDNCDVMLRDYYFYMAFENSFSEDYVTEKVLHGYDNYAVPIVYGGANYSRFLPAGSYINAREMHPYNLAFAMYKAIKDPKLYETYFKWTNLYTVESDPRSSHPLCELCEALHTKSRRVPAKEKFRIWWNDINGMKWCLSQEYWNETSLVNIDGSHIFRLY
ncbi:alpha-(1,3)-fucosyltransferase C-like [Zerene cesonia]|uniref:alpha-(1,3)-fucosyltransferase C-like n=1 Tax=Zerene cesonia TaxID=33412 RepID=UPI0018E4DEF4|nr:alpha-(1,3)-fucosyltransferase C-like [Zerene cesonia]